MTDPRYPIGKYEPVEYSAEQKKKWFLDIQFLPQELELAVQGLDEFQLQTPYREGGWTVQQLVHHVADSHMNAMIRFKLGLTEEMPIIKPYDENAWSLLNDVESVPINISVTLLHALHIRWLHTIKDLTEEEFQRKIIHPESGREMTLWFLLGLYAWHGKHHVAHITTLKSQNGWL